MSEVKRYMESCGEGGGVVEHRNGDYVSIKDFDRVTAELECSRGDFAQLERISDALQQRLTASDVRADVLETALRKIKVRLDAYAESDMRMPEPSVEVCQAIADAALKPAEGGGDE